MGRAVGRIAVDLDQAAAEVEGRWFVWTAAGIRVHPIIRAGAEAGEARSLCLRASRHNAQADVLLYDDGWVETAVRRPDATATIQATAQVDTVDAFGALLDRVVELITWSGPGSGEQHGAPARPAGSQRAAHWVLGFDGLPLPAET